MMLMIVIIIGLITAVSSYPACCTMYVRLMDTPSPVSESCSTTIKELMQQCWNHYGTSSCSSIQFLFQSGTRCVNEHIFIYNFGAVHDVTIRGEPGATIKCWKSKGLVLINIPSITIRDIHIWNCSCHSDNYYGNLSDRIIDGAQTKIGILNSEFTNSVLILFLSQCLCTSEPNLDCPYKKQNIIIKDTTIKNCCSSNWKLYDILGSVINFDQCQNDDFINLTFENVNFTENNWPLFTFVDHLEEEEYEGMYVFITFTGHSNLAHNSDTIILIKDSILDDLFSIIITFSAAEVYIINNTVTEENGSPIIIENGVIVLEHCHIIFSGNNGSIGSGGIKLDDNAKMVVNDNVATC